MNSHPGRMLVACGLECPLGSLIYSHSLLSTVGWLSIPYNRPVKSRRVRMFGLDKLLVNLNFMATYFEEG